MIHRSPSADRPIPDVTIHQLVLEGAARFGDRPALIDAASGRALSFREVVDGSRRLAAGLARRGLVPGDVFAILAPNVPEYALACLGPSIVGATVATLNPLLTEDEVAALLVEVRARYLLTVPALLEKAARAARRAGIEELFVIGDAPGAASFTSLLENGPVPALEIDPARHLAALPFSSGTSGRPKGVMLTHGNLVAQLVLFDAGISLPSGSTALAVLPYFHIYGLVLILLAHLWRGNTQVLMSRFELEPFLEAMARYRVAFAPLVPPIMVALAKHPLVDRYDLSGLRLVMCGAAPLGADVERAVSTRLGCAVLQGYGMTELAGASHLIPNDPARFKPGSVGLALPNVEVRVVDLERGASVGPGERGELWIRGPIVMQGYLHRPEATAAALVDGWLRTGDIGYVDEAGYFYVVDRVKELIKYNAYQVAPADLEAVLLGHPAIADAAVVPSPDPDCGEVPKAFVVLRETITADAIMSWVAERVAPYEKVRRVEVVDAIPKSPSGKILRRVLVERERARVASAG